MNCMMGRELLRDPLRSAERMSPGQVQHCLVQMDSELREPLGARAAWKEWYFSFRVSENHGLFDLRGTQEVKDSWGN